MAHNGATVYVRFSPQDKRLKNMMDPHHIRYRKIPDELVTFKEAIQAQYAFYVPMDFRYFYAYERFELMGVLTHYEDAIELVLQAEEKLAEFDYEVIITVGFGQVYLPERAETMANHDLLHTISGKGVLAAFAYFKEQEISKCPYYFKAHTGDCSFLNVPKEQLKQKKNFFKTTLKELQYETN